MAPPGYSLKVKRATLRAWALSAILAVVLPGGSACSRHEEGASAPPAAPGHSQKSSPSVSVPFAPLSLDEALARARAEKKLVFVDMYADWCGWCTKMDEDVFTDARVQTALLDYVPIKMDVDRGGRSVASRYRVDGLPAFLLLNGDGELVRRFEGYLPVEAFLRRLGPSGARG